MHCKKGKWINDNAAHAWNKIDKEYSSSLCSGGDEMVVNQIECLKKALGSRRSHIRGVGRVLKSVTPNIFPNENRDEEEERWQRQERAIEELRQDNASLRAQINQFFKLFPGMSTQLDVEDGREDDQEDDPEDDEFM
ncbi:hypothetical protein M8C21_021309 [Ambrosia artemisiifolia]|uniref:Uncharacterized protein n=1 Tax=Ambrosia artemisiifolia TaxID=4212 RepID=A0AAD5GQF2_AMBAR|nr:hypothetical protein M8C21_021309 [Ambrosia artemisiifolia]